MNEFKTVSQFPPIDSIPLNKIKNANIARNYGYVLMAHQVPRFPTTIALTDLTTYCDRLVGPRGFVMDKELVSKLCPNSIFLMTLNQRQTLKFCNQLKEIYGITIDLKGNVVPLHKLGVIIKSEYYLKNYNDHLEGMCIDLELVRDLEKEEQVQLSQLIDRIKDKFDTQTFHQRSPLVFKTDFKKRKNPNDILFQRLKKPVVQKKVVDARFDTQQILFNLNFSSDDDEEDDDNGDEDEERRVDENFGDEDSEVDSLEEAEESFISVITSLKELRKIPSAQSNGKTFKLFGYLIEYPRGNNEIIFVEETELTKLNDSNSLIVKIDKELDSLKTGKKLEISVMKQVVNIGQIKQIEFKIV